MPHPEVEQNTKLTLHLTRRETICAAVVAFVTVAGTLGRLYWSAGDPALDPAAQSARREAFRRAGQLMLPAVQPGDLVEALQTMQLATQPPGVRQAVEDSRQQLAWLTVWDDMDEDGDTVEIVSDGFARTVRLTNAPMRFAVPVPERGLIDVRGIYDGGGGITMSLMTTTGKVAMPIMDVGQVIGVPVQVGP